MKKTYYTLEQSADLLSTSKNIVNKWLSSGSLIPDKTKGGNTPLFSLKTLKKFDKQNDIDLNANPIRSIPKRDYKVIELFAGGGGLAIGLEKAGLKCALLNEIDRHACATLKNNRPHWNVVEGDIKEVDFTPYRDQIDVVTGGFPCQSFSYAGKGLGFEDARGTMFFEFARCIKETNPAICVGENVRGLMRHDGGDTIKGMISVLDELGYDVIAPQIFKTIFHRVPQKRERLLLVGIRKDLDIDFKFPVAVPDLYTVEDALKKGRLYDCDVPKSGGQKYPKRKAEILNEVPQGGYWRDLSDELQREYMQGSYFLGGGKTGMARRMSWSEPCLTLTCAPAQKQTERCHPEENRPFTVREYARIQTFPDDWEFSGSTTQQYKQIGNAVPVNFAEDVGHSIVHALNTMEKVKSDNIERMSFKKPFIQSKDYDCEDRQKAIS